MDKNAFINFLKERYETAKTNSRRNKPDYVLQTGDWYEYGHWRGIEEYLAGLITWLQNGDMAELELEEYKYEFTLEGENVEFAHEFLEQNK